MIPSCNIWHLRIQTSPQEVLQTSHFGGTVVDELVRKQRDCNTVSYSNTRLFITMYCRIQQFLYLFAVGGIIVLLCSHQAEALYDPTICDPLVATAASASTCEDWQSINANLAIGDCCSALLNADTTQCNSLCSTVITGLVDNCETSEQLGNFKSKSEVCQILTLEKAMEKATTCDGWGSIIRGDARAFCIPSLGKYASTDTKCTATCVNMIEKVPDYCIAQAIDYFQETPIRDFHENCTSKVVDRIFNKADKTCAQWKNLLRLSIESRVGCGLYGECTVECEALIRTVEQNCPGYVVTNEWTTIACAGGTTASGAAFGAQLAFPTFLIIVSFLAYLGL